jgi:hypothetical protein
VDKSGRPVRRLDTVKRRIVAIGMAARVVVDSKGKTPKCASAHDLRPTFRARWAHHVRPLVLGQLIRHESIDTAEKPCVGQNAGRTVTAVRDVFDGPLGDAFGGLRGDRFGEVPGEREHSPNPSFGWARGLSDRKWGRGFGGERGAVGAMTSR